MFDFITGTIPAWEWLDADWTYMVREDYVAGGFGATSHITAGSNTLQLHAESYCLDQAAPGVTWARDIIGASRTILANTDTTIIVRFTTTPYLFYDHGYEYLQLYSATSSDRSVLFSDAQSPLAISLVAGQAYRLYFEAQTFQYGWKGAPVTADLSVDIGSNPLSIPLQGQSRPLLAPETRDLGPSCPDRSTAPLLPWQDTEGFLTGSM